MPMTLTLELPSNLEARLLEEARRRGLMAAEYVLRLLDQNLPAEDPQTELVELLQSWIDEDDAGEQKETGDYLVRALDEDRPSNRVLYPPELEGVTW